MKSSLEKYGEWAVVTGGSSGIGYEIAKQLVAGGMKCVLVARGEHQLRLAVQEIGQNRCDYIVSDLSDPTAVDRLVQELGNRNIGMCVHSAGALYMGKFLDQPEDNAVSLIDLHVKTSVHLARVFGLRFRERGGGGFIFVSSSMGFSPMPFVSVYTGTKAFMINFAEALRIEWRPYNIDVVTLAPGGTNTKMADDIGRFVDLKKLPFPMGSPVPVATKALAKLKRPGIVVPGVLNRFIVVMMRYLPGPRIMAPLMGSKLGSALVATTKQTGDTL